MKTVCAWCSRVLDDDGPGNTPGPISHGICPACLAALDGRRPVALRELLDRFDGPVLCVGGNVELVTGNAAAERRLGRPLAASAGVLGGDLLECRFARLPGGCGTTVHCAACTLRRTVAEVHATGRPVVRARARIERDDGPGSGVRGGGVEFVISAEKTGGMVILRIDEAPGAGSAG